MKRTPWFPGDVKPVHVGVYERDYGPSASVSYCYWRGNEWGAWGETPPIARKNNSISLFPSLPWRGLTEKQA